MKQTIHKAYWTILIIGILIMGQVNNLMSQDRSLSTMPLLQTENFLNNQGENLIHTEAGQRCNAIYNRLVSARGDYRFPVPTLALRREVSKVASIDYDRLEIIIEEKAYQACEPYGDGAIAFLLAHELTHYYEKHAWRRGFVTEFSELQIAKDLSMLQDQIAYETEADYLGGFLAYSAGFGLFNKSAEVIKNLYAAYQVKDPIPGYPSLHDRMELCTKTSHKLEQLVELFEMANYLNAIGAYNEAKEYYKYVLMQFQSRELYNNIGMACILEALKYFAKEELVFQYALQLDLESSASRGDDKEAQISLRTKLLKQSIQYFDAAISMDPDYIPSYLNKANAFAILGDTVRARFYAEQEALPLAIKNKNKKSLADIKNLLGILKIKNGDPVIAEQLWNESVASGGQIAASNLYLLKNGREKWPEIKRTANVVETINSLSLESIAANLYFDRSKLVYLDQGNQFCQQALEDGPTDSHYFFNKNSQSVNGSNKFILFHKCKTAYKGASALGISIGDNGLQVIEKYGNPENRIGTATGEILVYPDIFFILNSENKVSSWVTYAIALL